MFGENKHRNLIEAPLLVQLKTAGQYRYIN